MASHTIEKSTSEPNSNKPAVVQNTGLSLQALSQLREPDQRQRRGSVMTHIV